MFRLIVAFPKLVDAKNLKNVLMRYGYEEIFACNSASQVISACNESDAGVVICGYRLPDMHYSELYGYIPREFSMLLVASPSKIDECVNPDIHFLTMPIHTNELVQKIQLLTQDYLRVKKRKSSTKNRRSEKEKSIILNAKEYLMDNRSMTEDEAHRYIQKMSMDSGNNIVETAEMILAFK